MDFVEEIHRCGLKATPGRVALLQHLYRASAPQCYEDVKASLAIDKATFYRTMATFENEHIVNSFESFDKRRYYEFRRNTHAHFICQICGGIECLESARITLPGYKIDTVVFKGSCSNCHRQNPQI